MTLVVKKDGRKTPFYIEKIESNLDSAERVFGVTFKEEKDVIIDRIKSDISKYDEINSSEVFRIIEKHLENEPLVLIAFKEFKRKEQDDIDKATDTDYQISRLDDKDKDVLNENGNKDSRTAMTQRDLLSGSLIKAKSLMMYPEDVRRAHFKGLIHLHDLDRSPYQGMPNCSLPDFEYMLKNGALLGNARVESPKSLSTAISVLGIMIAGVSNEQYGGVSVHELDKLLKPYAEMTHNKNIELYKGAGSPADEIERLAKEKTINDIHDAMQSLEYDINTMITSSAQTPFTTVSYGLGESWFEREIQKQHLNVRSEGLGKDKITAIFPKILYLVQDGVNLKKEDPNYDIKQLAVKTSAERIYPDMINVDDLMALKGGKKPITAMGCVRAGEQITWREKGKKTVVTPISELFEKYADDVKIQPNGKDEYIDLKDIEIKDSHTGEAEFVSCSRVIKNSGNKWLRIKITNGRLIECTDDHPFHTINRGRVLAKDLKEGDEIRLAEDELQDEELTPPEQIELDRNWLLGNIICDGTLHANSYVLITYAMNGEDEIRERIGRVYEQDKLYDKEQHRGDRGFYKEVSIKDPELRKECIESFRGVLKEDRKIPEEIFTQNRKMRLAFLGGMIDADGHISKSSSRIQIGSVNKELALGQLMLMASLGMNPKIYTNEYSSRSNKIRYRVEANATQEVIDEVVCVKKKENYTEKRRKKVNPKAIVREIEPLDIDEHSYDVTTGSDFFDVSGIVSHNCRSFLHYWEDKHGEEIYTGRNNLGVVSLNLPHLALQSKGNIDAFFENLDDALELVRKALHAREESVINADIEFLPILYTQGGLGDPTGKKTARDFYDGDRKKQASISIGFVGLHNAMVALTGNEDWHGVKELNDLSVQIVKYLHEYAGKIDDEFLATPSVYSTPSESLADRFAKIDRERFGIVKGVNEGEYYENSFHFPSNKDIDPVSKMRFESQYYPYTPGGFMFYVEQNNLSENLKGMESLWDGFNHFGNIYAGVNSPNDHCLDCGWEGESSFVKDQGYTCPSCGNFDPDRMSVVRRLCGYLGHPNKRPVVSGKQDEINARVKHN